MPQHPEPALVDENAPSGPTYAYRGVKILAGNEKATVTKLDWPEHPMHGKTKGVPGTWCTVIDWWLDRGSLPPWYKVAAGHEKPG